MACAVEDGFAVGFDGVGEDWGGDGEDEEADGGALDVDLIALSADEMQRDGDDGEAEDEGPGVLKEKMLEERRAGPMVGGQVQASRR